MSINKLIGEKVYLRPITMDDTALIVRWRSNPAVYMNLYSRKPSSDQEHICWMENNVLTGKCVQFIIVERQTDQPVGSVFIKNIDRQANKGEYGIFIGEDRARGKGLASEVAKLVLRYGFSDLGLHRVYLSVFAYNRAAIRSYERAGFEIEGIARDEFLDERTGRYEDVVWMAAIKEEWEHLL